MNDFTIPSSFMNFSDTDNPFLGFASSIGICLSAAAAATDTASASPVVPFTTAISDTSLIPSNLLAIAKAVSSLVFPSTLSGFKPNLVNSSSIDFGRTAVPPIRITFFAPNLFISSFVSALNFVFEVNNIGAFFAYASGVAVNASAIAPSFTNITVSADFQPSLDIFTAVSILFFPIKALSTVYAFTATTDPATIVAAITVAICFFAFIKFSSNVFYYI